MPKTAFINTRVDKALKTKAEKVLAQIGISTSDLVTILLHQVVLNKGVPFDLKIPNAETQAALAESEAGGGQRFTGSTKDVLDAAARRRQRARQ